MHTVDEMSFVYSAMGELKRDCEAALNIVDQLVEQNKESEFEKENAKNMSEHIQKLEEETDRLADYNKALEVSSLCYNTERRRSWTPARTTSRRWRTRQPLPTWRRSR